MASRRKQAKKQQRKAQRKHEKAGLNEENNNNELKLMAAAAGASDIPYDDASIGDTSSENQPEKDMNEDSNSSDEEEEIIMDREANSSDEEEKDEENEISFIVANDLRKGGFVLLRKEKHPCKVMEMRKAKTGKHGGAKIRVVGIDILSGKKYDDIFLSKEQIEIPIVKKIKCDLIKIENNEALLRDLAPAKKTTAAPSAPEINDIRIKLDPENNEIHADLVAKARGSRSVQVIVVNAMTTDAIAEVRTI